MNNLTLAGEGWTYYETIGGGQGACPDADGPSAVHVAMSNTLNTPVEALETEFPVRVRELVAAARLAAARAATAAATGSCASSRRSTPMRYTLITERRRVAPRGREGGADGAAGPQPAQRRAELPAKCAGELRRGRPAADRDARRRRLRACVRRGSAVVSGSGYATSLTNLAFQGALL